MTLVDSLPLYVVAFFFIKGQHPLRFTQDHMFSLCQWMLAFKPLFLFLVFISVLHMVTGVQGYGPHP